MPEKKEVSAGVIVPEIAVAEERLALALCIWSTSYLKFTIKLV